MKIIRQTTLSLMILFPLFGMNQEKEINNMEQKEFAQLSLNLITEIGRNIYIINFFNRIGCAIDKKEENIIWAIEYNRFLESVLSYNEECAIKTLKYHFKNYKYDLEKQLRFFKFVNEYIVRNRKLAYQLSTQIQFIKLELKEIVEEGQNSTEFVKQKYCCIL